MNTRVNLETLQPNHITTKEHSTERFVSDISIYNDVSIPDWVRGTLDMIWMTM